MAKLPSREDLGQMPSARSGRPIASVDTSAVAKGVIQFGKGIQNLGESGLAYARHQEAAEDYDAELRFRQFKFDQERDRDDQMQSVTPDRAVSFDDDWRTGYQERSGEFLKSVPQNLRGKYQLKVQEAERELYRPAAVFARTEQKRQATDKLSDYIDGYLAKGGNIDRGRIEFDEMLERNPWLSSIEKDEVRRKGLRRLEDLHVKGLIERGTDLGTVIRDLESGSAPQEQIDTQANPEARARPVSGSAPAEARQPISFRLETGQTDPLKGISNISHDSNGSRSYGNFGLNSQGSAQEFVRDYGAALGLKGEPGTPEFDRSWKEVARADPQGLHQAEMDWYGKTVLPRVTVDLTHAGVSDEVATDPRVQAYFADRLVQYGPASIGNHEARVAQAFEASGGDVAKFLRNMTEADRDNLRTDFRSALRSGVYSQKGHDTRTYGRLNLALTGEGGGAALPGKAETYAGPYKNLSGADRLELIHSARTRLAKAEEEAEKQRRANALFSGAIPVDPGSSEDRKLVDGLYTAMPLAASLQNATPEAMEAVVHLVDKTSYIPQPAMQALRGMAVNGNPGQKAYAYQVTGRIMREQPGAAGIDEDFKKDTTRYNTLVLDLGYTPEAAIAEVEKTKTPEFQKAKKALSDEGDKLSKALTVDDVVAKHDKSYFSTPEFATDQQRAEVQEAYREAFRMHYIETGNEQWAKQSALNQIAQTYGTSTITGRQVLMREPPEKYYKPIASKDARSPSMDYFTDDLKQTLREVAGKDIPLDKVVLRSGPTTFGDIARGRVPPSYDLLWIEEDANGIPAWRTAPRPFYVDVKAAKAKEAEIQEKAFREAYAPSEPDLPSRLGREYGLHRVGEAIRKEIDARLPKPKAKEESPSDDPTQRTREFLKTLVNPARALTDMEGNPISPDPELPRMPDDGAAAPRLRSGNREFFERQRQISKEK